LTTAAAHWTTSLPPRRADVIHEGHNIVLGQTAGAHLAYQHWVDHDWTANPLRLFLDFAETHGGEDGGKQTGCVRRHRLLSKAKSSDCDDVHTAVHPFGSSQRELDCKRTDQSVTAKLNGWLGAAPVKAVKHPG
jgi:hypothetical protein